MSVFFFKQKTAYEMRISDWSSDVCSSDLLLLSAIRVRGVTLMALSNKFGHMVLTTGNKSEMSVGYATLYGDMCGGYSVLKDVYKMTVFDQIGRATCRERVGQYV